MLSGSSYIPPFYFYQFADAISAPYTSLKAYQAGIIDSNGNLIKPESSLEPFEYLVIKLKQIFSELPYGMTKAKLNAYLPTLQLFAEEAEEYNFNSEYMHALIEGYISQMTDGEVSYLELCEDMGSGGGGAGSLGTPMGGSGDNVGVAGFDPPLMDKVMKRKYLQNCEIFEVCPEEYATFKNAKSWKNIPEGPTKNYLQRFQRRNKGAKIAVRTTLPESGDQDLYWITYPAKSFMEEYGLENVDFLVEQKQSNKEREHLVYSSFGNLLDEKGFKRNTEAKKKEDLAVGEYGIFHPSNEKTDVVVHHDLSGAPGFSHAETKYQRHVPGRSSTTYDVVIPHSELDVQSSTGKRHRLNPASLIQHFGVSGKSKVRRFLRRGTELIKKTIPAILKSKGGMMLVGNDKNVHITHNTDDESIKAHDEALLSHLGLSSTHTAEDLSKSGNPYLGNIGREGGGEHVKIRVSAPKHVMRNGQKVDTIESQQKNAETLRIPSLKDFNPE